MRSLIALTLLLLLVSSSAFAVPEGSIIQVTRRLRMSVAEPLPPKDFYLDIGEKDGVRKGQVLEVFRSIAVLNAVIGAPHQLLNLPLGEVVVIALGEGSSIARLQVQIDANQLPAMESSTFMVGDTVRAKSDLPFRQ